MKASTVIGLFWAGLVAAVHPTENCVANGTIQANSYTIRNAQFNPEAVGNQCISDLSPAGAPSLTWSTHWNWTSNHSESAASFANAQLNFTATPLSSITSISSNWHFTSQIEPNSMASTAYYLFTSATCNGPPAFEIQIRLASYGQPPVVSSLSGEGNPKPAYIFCLRGVSYRLYKGTERGLTVFTFVASGNLDDYSGDLSVFLKILERKNELPETQCLTRIHAGAQVFDGIGALTTLIYSTSVVGTEL